MFCDAMTQQRRNNVVTIYIVSGTTTGTCLLLILLVAFFVVRREEAVVSLGGWTPSVKFPFPVKFSSQILNVKTKTLSLPTSSLNMSNALDPV